MNNTPARSKGPTKAIRSLSRGTRLVLGGGLAIGAGFAAVTGISSAASAPSSTAATGSAPAATAPAPATGPGGPAHHGLSGHHRPLGGRDGMRRGGGGTITAINGSTLTLRTENGTETVDTSTATTYHNEMQSVSFTTLKVGDVVHVASARPRSTSSASTRPEPGTGTVAATRVTVVEPSFAGRVTAIGNGTYTLVGRDGQLSTVTTTGSTRYDKGTAQAPASAVAVGDRVRAVGPKNSLTHLTADLITVGPARATAPSQAPPAPSSPASPAGA